MPVKCVSVEEKPEPVSEGAEAPCSAPGAESTEPGAEPKRKRGRPLGAKDKTKRAAPPAPPQPPDVRSTGPTGSPPPQETYQAQKRR